ncbi:hypothetical protein C922_00063 [Plasmodium inui San Antonio 1]|uniref:Calpain catalytic domain-containing protein n=1 Tax=Plasmodium inui San Antonio 1 TaxID=1237626 RepID=W7ABY7_9APIC|nr:hypothetical protein C922_00063 [Plasmodium inui San Antonio 1]EUD69200.1 hypothetical protein C922_00063 [Plasmodium inui San Antonio 1]
MEDTLLKHRIVDFGGNKNALDLWKKYVTEEVLREPALGRTGKKRTRREAKREAKRVDTWLNLCGQRVHHWRDPNEFPECQSEEVPPDDGRQFGKGEEGRKNDTLLTEKNKCRNNGHDDLVSPPDEEERKKKKKEEKELLSRERKSYLEGFEKLLEKLDQDTKQHFNKHQNDQGAETHGQCIVTYQNYECRNADVTYREDVDFFRFFYSSVSLIKENKALIPRGNYLYELIHPQTSSSFPVPNKLSYYLVKLFINNKWRLVFVHLTLSYNEKNQILSCRSLDEKELWPHILMEALLTCFRLFPLPDYHFYLLEMLTGLKFINKSYEFSPFADHLRTEKCFFIPCAVLSGRRSDRGGDRSSVNFCDNADVAASPQYLHEEQRAPKDASREEQRPDHSEETTNLVHTGNRQEDTTANLCAVPNHRLSSSETLKSSPPHEDPTPGRFFFLICSVEKEHIKIKCENVKPRHCTSYSDYQQSVLKAKKDVFLKGYAYINDRGNIRIKDTELVPVNTLTPPKGSPDGGNEGDQGTDKNLSARDTRREPQRDSCSDATCDTCDITVNEDNAQEVLQLIRKILGDGKNSTKRPKTGSEESDGKLSRMGTSKSGKKNAHKHLDKWLDEGELERLTQKVNVKYTWKYLIRTNGSFLAKGETIFFLVNRSHFEVASTDRYAKDRTAKIQGSQKNHNKVKVKKKDSSRDTLSSASNATQEESFPYLILICSVRINRSGNNSELSLLREELKTQNGANGPSSSNGCTNSDHVRVAPNEESLSDGLHEFCFSFFSCKVGRRKKCAAGDTMVRKRNETRRNIFSHADSRQGGLLHLLTSKLGSVPEEVVMEGSNACCRDNSALHSGEKHAMLSPKDILNCECFVRKIGEERLTPNEDAKGGDKADRERTPLRVLAPNLFLNNSGHDEWRDYPFDEEIRKRNIHLRGNMEHFFLVYVKRSRRGDFSVEWLEKKKKKTEQGGTSKQAKKSDDTQHGNNSLHSRSEEKLISCSFISVEEYLEKKLKMKMAFLKKKLTIGEECPMKVLLKYTVTIPQMRNLRTPFFYVIHKVNELKVLPHLDLYICNVSKWNGSSDVQNARGRKKKKTKKSEKNENSMDQKDEEEGEDKGEDEQHHSHNGMKNLFYKISMENFIQKICIPPGDNNDDDGKDECTYLFLVVSKKVERLIGKDLHFEIAIASPSSDKDTSCEEQTKKKKTNIRLNEVSSFCKRYSFNDSGEYIDLGVKKDCRRENSSGGVNPKNDNRTVADNCSESLPLAEKRKGQTEAGIDNVHLNHYNCERKTKRFKLIKKVSINSKRDSTWGSIYVKLNNPHLFKNIVVKIVKLKRKKITHEKCANLNFITNNWGREIILKRRRKKSVFFKHVELATSDSYLLQVEVNMLSDTAQKRWSGDISPVCLPQRGNNISEPPSKKYSYIHPNILMNVLLNFSDDVSLEEDTSNEDVEIEMKKFFDFSKINLENLTLSSQYKHMDNIFSLKNDLLFRYRGNYDEVFGHLSKVCTGDLQSAIPSTLSVGENSHTCDGIRKKYTKGTHNWVNPLSDNHYDDLLCTNKAEETKHLEPSMGKEHFFQALSSVLNLSKETSAYVESKVLHPGSDRVGRSSFAQMLQVVGNETRCLSFGAVEKLEKFEKYPFAKLMDIPTNTDREEKKRKEDDPTSKEFEASFDSFLSLSTAAKKTIDDLKATYNLKNKLDIYRIKMDAELQLRENTFFSLGGKIGSTTRTVSSVVKKNSSRLDKTQNGAYNSKGCEKGTVRLTNGGANPTAEDHIPSCDEDETDSHDKKGIFYVQHKIDPPIENLQDLINVVKRVNTSIDINDTKNRKLKMDKMVKERKAFIENIKNNVKTNRFKNHPTEELKNIYKKGTELKLHIYNPDLMKYIKTHYLLLDNLNDIRGLLNPSKLRRIKMTTNEKETFNVEEAVTDKKLFMQLFRKCSDVIKNDTNLQLSDSYKNLCKDAQQIFNKMIEGT